VKLQIITAIIRFLGICVALLFIAISVRNGGVGILNVLIAIPLLIPWKLVPISTSWWFLFSGLVLVACLIALCFGIIGFYIFGGGNGEDQFDSPHFKALMIFFALIILLQPVAVFNIRQQRLNPDNSNCPTT
jgi:hypothetical protein